MPAATPPSPSPSARQDPPVLFVLLGASNLARGYTALARTLFKGLKKTRSETLHALGPGRAYCARGGVFFFISYSPIVSSGILEAVREKAAQGFRIVVVAADLGNDIMYGIPAEGIVSNLENLFLEFKKLDADIIAFPIFVDMEQDVSAFQFKLLKTIFFPGSSVDFAHAASAIQTINEFLRTAAKQDPRITLLPDMRDCCGMDKIHFSFFKCHRVWSRVTEEIFRVLNVATEEKVSPLRMTHSLFANLGRLVFCDFLRVVKKEKGSF